MLGDGGVVNSAKVIREHLGGERVVWTIDSGVTGPVLGLTANIHGDESTGVVVLNRWNRGMCYKRGSFDCSLH